jgi:anti-anti-sigma factor
MSEIKSASCNKILTDLRELVSIGSVGIGFLAGIYASVTKNPGGRFVLVGPQRRVQEVLDLTRLTSIIPLVTDIASGMAVLRGEKTAESTAS